MSGVPTPSMGATADNRFTQDADTILRGTGERIVWQGKPSLWYLLSPAFKWGCVLFLTLVVAAVFGSQQPALLAPQQAVTGPVRRNAAAPVRQPRTANAEQPIPPLDFAVAAQWGWYWILFLVVCAALNLLWKFLELKSTTYRVTSQRLEVTAGILGSRTSSFELFGIQQPDIKRSIPWRFFGLGDLEFGFAAAARLTPQSRPLTLKGIKNPVVVRDLIYSSTNLFVQRMDRQRF